MNGGPDMKDEEEKWHFTKNSAAVIFIAAA